jgi:hypothetical protein
MTGGGISRRGRLIPPLGEPSRETDGQTKMTEAGRGCKPIEAAALR